MALHHHIAKHKKIIYRVFVVLVVFFVGWGVVSFVQADTESRARYKRLSSEMEEVTHKMSSLEAIEQSELTRYRGNGVIGDYDCGLTESCPEISKQWLVAIEPSKEIEFLRGLVKAGYIVNRDFPSYSCEHLEDPGDQCFLNATKEKVDVSYGLRIAHEERQPKGAIGSKQWYEIRVEFTHN
ncbi:MAG TPA: hypothetical protein VFO38_00500 [Candidatus Saccharimonadales bacterium]|nr:hypothetical protein [Candidatus Saccharimonadales bacterium]